MLPQYTIVIIVSAATAATIMSMMKCSVQMTIPLRGQRGNGSFVRHDSSRSVMMMTMTGGWGRRNVLLLESGRKRKHGIVHGFPNGRVGWENVHVPIIVVIVAIVAGGIVFGCLSEGSIERVRWWWRSGSGGGWRGCRWGRSKWIELVGHGWMLCWMLVGIPMCMMMG